jgi:hypothetical protein
MILTLYDLIYPREAGIRIDVHEFAGARVQTGQLKA